MDPQKLELKNIREQQRRIKPGECLKVGNIRHMLKLQKLIYLVLVRSSSHRSRVPLRWSWTADSSKIG